MSATIAKPMATTTKATTTEATTTKATTTEATTKVTTTKATTTTTTTGKPLLCHLEGPPQGASDKDRQPFLMQRLPYADACDYVILEIHQDDKNSYKYEDYSFLVPLSLSTPLLFTVDNKNTLPNATASVKSAGFRMAAENLYKAMYCRGFGLIEKQENSWTSLDLYSAFFKELKVALTAAQYPENEMRLFFVFHVGPLPGNVDAIKGALAQLDTVVHVIALLTPYLPRSPTLVECVSSWNSSCYADDKLQPSTTELLDLITNLAKPRAVFALTLTMTAYKFPEAQLTYGQSAIGVNSDAAVEELFEEACRRVIYRPGNTGRITFYKPCACNLYSHATIKTAYAFETKDTVREKITRAYEHIKSTKSNVTLGWLLFNVSRSLAPSLCGGDFSRLKAAREAIDQYRTP